LFIQSTPHTWCHKKGHKTPMYNSATNKTMPSGNNKQFTLNATKSEYLEFQVKKCPIDGWHKGAPQHIAYNC